MSAPVVESEEFFDILCHSCADDGDKKEAQGFCNECQEYLCDMCIKFHRKVTKTKMHTILDRSEMPKTKVAPKSRDALIEVCPKHSEEMIKYFCDNHSCLACSVCLSLDHRTCASVVYIPDVSPNVEADQDLVQVRADLDAVSTTVAKEGEEAKKLSQTARRIHSSALTDLEAIRTKINEYLDEIQAEHRQQMLDIENSDICEFETIEKKNMTLGNKIGAMKRDLDEKENQKKKNGLFIAMKQAKEMVSTLKVEKSKASNPSKPTEYSFRKDDILQKVRTHLQEVWTLDRHQDMLEATARFVGHLNVHSEHDKNSCYISSIVLLPDDQIAVADLENKSVKLVCPTQNQVTAHVTVSSQPYDMALVEDRDLAVTLGQEKKVQMIRVSANLIKQQVFSVPGICKGIEYFDRKLFMICYDLRCVYVTNLQGVKLQEISGSWTMPSRITLNSKGELFITDHMKSTVSHLASDGTELAKFTNSAISGTLGIAYDLANDSVFVVGWESANVIQLNSSCQLIKTLISSQHGLSHPVAVASKAGKIYVSLDSKEPDSNQLKVYKFI